MREFIKILEAASDTVTLYRGDSTKIDQFDISKTSAEALLGIGIYLTDDITVAKDYTISKHSDDVVFRSDKYESPPTDIKQLTAEYLRFLSNPGVDRRMGGSGELDKQLFDLKVKWEQKYHRDSTNIDWTDKEARAKVQDGITAQFKAERSAMIRKAVERAKAEFKKMRPGLRVTRLTTGEYIFTKKDRGGAVTHFDIPKEYVARCLDVESPLPDEMIPVIKAAFTRASREGDPDQAWDLRHWDEKGNEVTGRNFDQFIDGYKKLGARYAWADHSMGEDNTNPSLDFIWNGTFAGYHVFQNNREAQQALIDDLKKLGYVGYSYAGGVRMTGTAARGGGGVQHTAYVFWDAGEINSFRSGETQAADDEVGDFEKGIQTKRVYG